MRLSTKVAPPKHSSVSRERRPVCSPRLLLDRLQDRLSDLLLQTDRLLLSDRRLPPVFELELIAASGTFDLSA